MIMIGDGVLLASSGVEAGLGGAATLMVVGLVVVFTTLVVLAISISLLVRFGRESEPAMADAGEAEAPSAEEFLSGGIDRRHLVVISAAVAASVGPRARVHRVVMLGREAGAPWVTEGRIVLMGSHRLHR